MFTSEVGVKAYSIETLLFILFKTNCIWLCKSFMLRNVILPLLETNENFPLQPNMLVVDVEKFTSSSTGKL